MNDRHLSDSRPATVREDYRMAHEELLRSLLDDVLANDQEIRDGAQSAEVSLDELRTAVRRRFPEALADCVQEQNLMTDLQGQVDAEREAIELIRRRPAWYLRTARILAWATIAAVVLAAAFTWIAWGVGGNRQLGVLWTQFPIVSVGLGGTALMVAVGVVALVTWVLHRRHNAALHSAEYQLLVARKRAAKAAWEAALRDRGLKGLLREEINIRLPRYPRTRSRRSSS